MYREYLKLKSEKINKNAFVFIPVGSIEGHGPSLPVGTDLYIAWAFALRFAERTDGILFPPIPFGVSSNTGDFELTVSFSHKTLIDIIETIGESLCAKGFSRIVLVNIHKGNDAAIKTAVERLIAERDLSVYYINPYTFFTDDETEIFKGEDNSFKEASLLKAANEILELMLADSADLGEEKILRSDEFDLLRKNGYLGFKYPSEMHHIQARSNASADKGMQYIQAAADKAAGLCKAYSDFLMDKGGVK